MESCGLSGLRESYSLDFPLEKVCPISAKIQCLRCQSQTPLVPIWGSPKSEGMCGSNPSAQQRPAQQRGSARPRCSVPLLLPHPNISWAESRSCSLPLPGVRAARALCGFQQLEFRVTAWYRPWGATQAGKSAVMPSSCWLCVQIYIAALQFISHEHVSPKHLPLSCFQTPWEFSHGHAGKWCLILMVQVQGWSNGKQINF